MWWSIVSLLLGATGWFGAKLLADPLLAIYALRMEVQETLVLDGNLEAEAASEDRSIAAARFRKVGSALVANHLAAWPWVQWFYRRILGWDPYSAGEICMGYGKLIGEGQFSKPNLHPLTSQLRSRLKLPRPIATDLLRQTFERAGWGDPHQKFEDF